MRVCPNNLATNEVFAFRKLIKIDINYYILFLKEKIQYLLFLFFVVFFCLQKHTKYDIKWGSEKRYWMFIVLRQSLYKVRYIIVKIYTETVFTRQSIDAQQVSIYNVYYTSRYIRVLSFVVCTNLSVHNDMKSMLFE